MPQKRITISSTSEFEKKVLKFIHSQRLKSVKINRSELYRNAIEFYINNELRKKKPGREL